MDQQAVGQAQRKGKSVSTVPSQHVGVARRARSVGDAQSQHVAAERQTGDVRSVENVHQRHVEVAHDKLTDVQNVATAVEEAHAHVQEQEAHMGSPAGNGEMPKTQAGKKAKTSGTPNVATDATQPSYANTDVSEKEPKRMFTPDGTSRHTDTETPKGKSQGIEGKLWSAVMDEHDVGTERAPTQNKPDSVEDHWLLRAGTVIVFGVEERKHQERLHLAELIKPHYVQWMSDNSIKGLTEARIQARDACDEHAPVALVIIGTESQWTAWTRDAVTPCCDNPNYPSYRLALLEEEAEGHTRGPHASGHWVRTLESKTLKCEVKSMSPTNAAECITEISTHFGEYVLQCHIRKQSGRGAVDRRGAVTRALKTRHWVPPRCDVSWMWGVTKGPDWTHLVHALSSIFLQDARFDHLHGVHTIQVRGMKRSSRYQMRTFEGLGIRIALCGHVAGSLAESVFDRILPLRPGDSKDCPCKAQDATTGRCHDCDSRFFQNLNRGADNVAVLTLSMNQADHLTIAITSVRNRHAMFQTRVPSGLQIDEPCGPRCDPLGHCNSLRTNQDCELKAEEHNRACAATREQLTALPFACHLPSVSINEVPSKVQGKVLLLFVKDGRWDQAARKRIWDATALEIDYSIGQDDWNEGDRAEDNGTIYVQSNHPDARCPNAIEVHRAFTTTSRARVDIKEYRDQYNALCIIACGKGAQFTWFKLSTQGAIPLDCPHATMVIVENEDPMSLGAAVSIDYVTTPSQLAQTMTSLLPCAMGRIIGTRLLRDGVPGVELYQPKPTKRPSQPIPIRVVSHLKGTAYQDRFKDFIRTKDENAPVEVVIDDSATLFDRESIVVRLVGDGPSEADWAQVTQEDSPQITIIMIGGDDAKEKKEKSPYRHPCVRGMGAVRAIRNTSADRCALLELIRRLHFASKREMLDATISDEDDGEERDNGPEEEEVAIQLAPDCQIVIVSESHQRQEALSLATALGTGGEYKFTWEKGWAQIRVIPHNARVKFGSEPAVIVLVGGAKISSNIDASGTHCATARWLAKGSKMEVQLEPKVESAVKILGILVRNVVGGAQWAAPHRVDTGTRQDEDATPMRGHPPTTLASGHHKGSRNTDSEKGMQPTRREENTIRTNFPERDQESESLSRENSDPDSWEDEDNLVTLSEEDDDPILVPTRGVIVAQLDGIELQMTTLVSIDMEATLDDLTGAIDPDVFEDATRLIVPTEDGKWKMLLKGELWKRVAITNRPPLVILASSDRHAKVVHKTLVRRYRAIEFSIAPGTIVDQERSPSHLYVIDSVNKVLQSEFARWKMAATRPEETKRTMLPRPQSTQHTPTTPISIMKRTSHRPSYPQPGARMRQNVRMAEGTRYADDMDQREPSRRVLSVNQIPRSPATTNGARYAQDDGSGTVWSATEVNRTLASFVSELKDNVKLANAQETGEMNRPNDEFITRCIKQLQLTPFCLLNQNERVHAVLRLMNTKGSNNHFTNTWSEEVNRATAEGTEVEFRAFVVDFISVFVVISERPLTERVERLKQYRDEALTQYIARAKDAILLCIDFGSGGDAFNATIAANSVMGGIREKVADEGRLLNAVTQLKEGQMNVTAFFKELNTVVKNQLNAKRIAAIRDKQSDKPTDRTGDHYTKRARMVQEDQDSEDEDEYELEHGEEKESTHSDWIDIDEWPSDDLDQASAHRSIYSVYTADHSAPEVNGKRNGLSTDDATCWSCGIKGHLSTTCDKYNPSLPNRPDTISLQRKASGQQKGSLRYSPTGSTAASRQAAGAKPVPSKTRGSGKGRGSPKTRQ